MNLTDMLFSFEGRIGRASYLGGVACLFAANVVIGLIAGSMGRGGQGFAAVLMLLIVVLSAWMSLALAIKRFR